MRPDYIDLRGIIPHKSNSPHIRRRPLSHIAYKMVHYTEDSLPASATQEEEVQRFIDDAVFHQQKDWSIDGSGVFGWTLMYHYGIGPSGRIYILNNENEILWNCHDGNPVALATVLILDSGQQPTKAMLATLQQQLDHLCTERPDLPGVARQTVFGHGETAKIHGGGPNFGNNTRCPGTPVLKFVRNYRNAIVATPPPETLLFQRTGQTIPQPFLSFFLENGQIPMMGLPITGVMQEELGGQPFNVQYFERARLEDHGAGGLRRGLIGAELQQLKGAQLKPRSTPVAARFASFYEANNGLTVFGHPISEEMTETLSDGKDYVVQYFQRARLEDHKSNGILRGLIGSELLALRAGAARLDH